MKTTAAIFALILSWLLPQAARAAVLTLDKTVACPGSTVKIDGSGWLEPNPVCFFRFSFDPTTPGSFVMASADQPNGLFGPPNSSFVVPADTKPGPHTVKCQLFLNTGELLQEETQPLTIVEVKFEGATDCTKNDSGFDDEMDTVGQPWLSVAEGQTTKIAKAKIKPNSAANKVRFRSSAEGTLTVAPAQAAGPDTTLMVTGVALGEAKVEATDETETDTCGELNVAVYKKKTLKVSVHIVQLKDCAKPKLKPADFDASAFEKKLNKIWDQAAVKFTVTSKHFVGAKAIVGADDDADCVADEAEPAPGGGDPVTFGPELMKIHDAAKDAAADVNVYFVQSYQVPLAAYHDVPNVVFAMSFGDQSPSELADDLLVAHELGHHLTLNHCDPCATLDKDALMHSANTGCRLRKAEWDSANGSVP